jgi:hypothetical protein
VVGRLVKKKEVGRRNKDSRQGVAIALAAGEDAERLEDVVAAEEKTAEERTELDFRDFEGGAADVVEHAGIAVEDFVLVLREILADYVVAEFDMAGGGCFIAGEELDEGGLACAVDADESYSVAAIDGEVHVLENLLFTVALGQVFCFND